MLGPDPLADPVTGDPVPTRRRVPRTAPVAATALLLPLLLSGCAQAEEAARGAARDAVAQATAAVGEAGSESGRQLAGQAVSDALDALPGTCADVLALPASVRDEQARTVLRSFWVAELDTGTPPQETVEAFEVAVVQRCDDSRETQAADVLREVWESGAFGP